MAYENKDTSELDRARAWLEMAQAKWRLQTMQHRSRYNPKTGEYRQLPTRIRRFLNGTPVGMKTAVLAILRESAPYRSPVFDCETDEGLLYRPTNTFIRKDGIEHATGGKDPTYTIIQDLLLDDGRDDAFMFRDESSCAQVGKTEYHWDEPEVVDCPDGGQGVSWQVTDINRDRETDLFSYRVRKVQAITIHVPPHVTECDGRKRVETEIWDNVYGEPGAYAQDPVRGGSLPVQIPEPCGQPDGRTVRIDVYRNPDCTYRLTVQTVYAVADDLSQYSMYKDQYKTSKSERALNQRNPLPRSGVEYANGVTTRYTSEKNEDGTWNNATERDTEREVLESTVETRVTPRGMHTLRVDTNVQLPASGITTRFGSWKTTKTPGGLYTNEYSEYARRDIEDLGLSCSDNSFMKTHETQGGAAEVPSGGTHVPPAANGLVTTWTYDTDAEGFVTRRVRTEQEHTVENAVKRVVRGWLATTNGVTHRSVSAARANSLLSSSSKGRTVEVRLTNGGLYDVEVQTSTPISGESLGSECAKTVYQHVHESVSGATSVGSGHTGNAGGGHTYRTSYSRDPSTGAVTKREQDTHEQHVAESRRAVRVTARGIEVRTTESGASSKPADAAGAGTGVDWEVTPGGLYNVTRTSTTPTQGDIGLTCEKDVFVHSDGTTSVKKALSKTHVDNAGNGRYGQLGARLGDDGLWEVTETTHKEKQVTGEVHVAVTSRSLRRTEITRQTNAKPAEPQAVVQDAGKELRLTKTRGGLWNVESTTTVAIAGQQARECGKDAFLHTDTLIETRNQKTDDEVADTTDLSGVYRSRSQRLGDDGLWSVSNTTNTEKKVSRQRVECHVGRRGLVKRTTDMQTTENPQDLQASAGNVGKTQVVEKTRGGRRNVTKTELTAIAGTIDEMCEKTAFLHTHSTVESATSKSLSHVDAAANGIYRSESWSLSDDGFWEKRHVDNEEEQPQLRTQQYQDAFGETVVIEEFSHAAESGGQGGKVYQRESKVQSVEASLTNGNRYTVRTRTETPQEVDSGWLHTERKMSNGLAVYYDFITFRNATLQHVRGWLNEARNIGAYTGTNGSFSGHPNASISPNKFGLWDGTVSVTIQFTPKAWASGGTTKDDDWDVPVTVRTVSFVPLTGSKLLKIIAEETHRKGGGVGQDKAKVLLKDGVIKGSQFSFHPGGQAYSYDLITKVTTKGVVIDMPRDNLTTIWDGSMSK